MKLLLFAMLIHWNAGWLPSVQEVRSWRQEWQHDERMQCNYAEYWAQRECNQRHPLKA